MFHELLFKFENTQEEEYRKQTFVTMAGRGMMKLRLTDTDYYIK